MSDEQREQGRDASAPVDGSRHDQPQQAWGAGPGHPEQPHPAQAPATQPPAAQVHAAQPGAAQPHAAQPGQAYGQPGYAAAYPGSGYAGSGYAGGYGAGYTAAPGAARTDSATATDRPDTSQFAAANGAGWAPQGSTSTIEKPRRQRGMGTVVAAAVIAGIVGGGAGFGGAYALLGEGSPGTTLTQSPASSASNAANTVPGSVAAAAAKAMPSTVDIQVSLSQGTAEGSGVILTADGDVLTNNHVVAGATGTITVTLADGTEHQATVVGTSPSYDLAVIKLQGVSGLTPATLGESSSVQVGQQVVAIGSPQGLTGTVTTGIVSAFNRTVSVQGESGGAAVVYNGLQTDAPINQGNSGGPLVNLDGQVVGINSAIATGSSQSTGSIGLGFAIPVDQAKRVAQEIIKGGTATKPVLGVQGSTGTQSGSDAGATIAGVQAGSPAAAAGLAAGDVVTKVGDAKVEDFSDLVARVGSYAPGAQVALTVNSGGSTKTVQVTLGSQADKAASTSNGGENANPFGGSNGGSPFGNLIPFGGGGN